jgi:hypothetical protein
LLTLSGAVLSDYQACERRIVLGREWQASRHRPKALFDHCLRWAIFEISNGADPVQCAAGATQQFVEACTDPGIDVIGDPYSQAKDWCPMLETITRCLGRLVLLRLKRLAPVQLDDDTRWDPAAWADDSGELHRWVTVSEWDQDALVREVHGWHAFGDMAVLGQPMTLHAIHIGQMRKGRRASTWARGWRHPVIQQRIRFRQTDGKPFEGWRAVHLADLPARWDEWAEQIFAEGAVTKLIQHQRINAPSAAVCIDTAQQIRTEAAAIRFLLESQTLFHQLPMSRSACDGHVPCIWQNACYTEQPMQSLAGLYRSRLNQHVSTPVPFGQGK